MILKFPDHQLYLFKHFISLSQFYLMTRRESVNFLCIRNFLFSTLSKQHRRIFMISNLTFQDIINIQQKHSNQTSMKYFKILTLLLLISLILNVHSQTVQFNQNPSQQTTKQPSGRQDYSKIAISGFGILLVLIEAFVWRRQVKQSSLVSFSVFTRDHQFEISSGKAQTNNMISVDKNQNVIINQEPASRDQSPGIKTIKGMTSLNTDDTKKRRKRKADKLSDRRSKQSNQQQEQS